MNLNRSPLKRGPPTDAEQTLAGTEHEAVARWIWQKNEQKKRGTKLNKQQKKYLEEQAAKKLAAEQNALCTAKEEGEYYDGAYIKEEPGTEMGADVEPPVMGPLNFADAREFRDLKQEPQEMQQDPSAELSCEDFMITEDAADDFYRLCMQALMPTSDEHAEPRKEPQKEEENPYEPLPQSNRDNNPVHTEPGGNAREEVALGANGTEEVGSTENGPKKYPTKENFRKTRRGPDCDKSSRAGNTSTRLSPPAAVRPHKCAFAGCKWSFAKRKELLCHERTHTGERPYRCTVCAKSFRRQQYLRIHLRVHTGERPLKCDECGKRFAGKSGLRYHKACVHSGERPHKCDECSARFVRRQELTLHRKVHTSGGPIFLCKTCGRAFSRDITGVCCRAEKPGEPLVQANCGNNPVSQTETDRNALEEVAPDVNGTEKAKHNASGNKERQNPKEKPKTKSPCPVCGKQFTSSYMEQHMRVHTGEMPFECDECDKRFAGKSGLQRHKALMHSGERPHKCDKCSARFVRRQELMDHSKVHTSGGPIFSCLTCGRAFSRHATTMLDRSPRKRGPPTDTEQTLADMEHDAVARWIWQKNEQKKRARKLNKQHKEYLQEQAAKELAAEQNALCTAQEEEGYDYEGAYIKEELDTEVAPEVRRPIVGPFNFVEPGEFHDLKQEPQAEQENPDEPLPRSNRDNSTVHMEPAGNARANLKKALTDAGCEKSSSAGSTSSRLSSQAAVRPHKCAYAGCKWSFAKRRELLCHERTHTGERPYACSVAECTKSFARKDTLQAHLQTHAGHNQKASRENNEGLKTKDKSKKKSQCAVCGRQVASSYIKQHMRSHTGERPYRCTVCAKSFRRQQYLRIHLRVHTGERPLKCDECGKRFAEKSGLRYHKACVHSGERPHKCDECSARFVRRQELTLHSKVHTSGGPIFQCKACGRAFSRDITGVCCRAVKPGESGNNPVSQTETDRNALEEVAQVANGTEKANRKARENKEKQNPKDKPKKKSPCHACDKEFSRWDMKKHMRVHTGERPFKCDECSARFVHRHDLTLHSKVHTGGGPIFPCMMCGRAFARDNARIRHSMKCQADLSLLSLISLD